MMHIFLLNNREILIQRWRRKGAHQPAHTAPEESQDGVSLFLDQLIETLKLEQTLDPLSRGKTLGSSRDASCACDFNESAAKHGRELLQLGFSIDQVVHGYGDLCPAITDLAYEHDESFQVDEFRTLNRCLDNAIASAVTEFVTQRDSISAHDTALEI